MTNVEVMLVVILAIQLLGMLFNMWVFIYSDRLLNLTKQTERATIDP